jgi:hypothetical protein
MTNSIANAFRTKVVAVDHDAALKIAMLFGTSAQIYGACGCIVKIKKTPLYVTATIKLEGIEHLVAYPPDFCF